MLILSLWNMVVYCCCVGRGVCGHDVDGAWSLMRMRSAELEADTADCGLRIADCGLRIEETATLEDPECSMSQISF